MTSLIITDICNCCNKYYTTMMATRQPKKWFPISKVKQLSMITRAAASSIHRFKLVVFCVCQSSHLFYTCKSQPSLLLIQFGFPDAIMFKTKGYYTWCFVAAALRNLLEVRMIYNQQATINTRYFLWCNNWSIPTEILQIDCRKIMAGNLKCFELKA